MNHESRIKGIFIVIIILAGVLRFWGLGANPPGLTWDEASLGYNAYSLLQTGRDEYGTILPLNLKSFGDYKPAVYAYLDIPFVGIFGLNEVAVRLPSALAGVGFVVLVYLLSLELFKNQKLSLAIAFMAAISPLSIQFSRAAYESNVALFLNTLGAYFFLKGLRKNKYLIYASILLLISLITYQASRVFVPILIVGLLVIFRKEISFNKWFKISAGVLIAGFILVSVVTFLLGQSSRLAAINFFAYQRSEAQVNLIAAEDSVSKNSFYFQALHGEWLAYIRGLFERYLIYFSPRMLFIDGDYDPRHRVPDLGVLLYTSLFLIPLGIYFLGRQRNKSTALIFFWLLTASVPAVLSRDLINMVRALNLTLPLVFLEGAGLFVVMDFLKKRRRWIGAVFGIILFGLLAANFLIYLDRYFVHGPKELSEGWVYGEREVNQLLSTDLSKYKQVVVSDKYGQPYIFYLFYTKYPPEKFQKQAVLVQPSVDVGTVQKIDNIEFRHIYWPADRGGKNSLFVGTLDELPDQDVKPFPEFSILKDVYFPDKQHAFRMVETK